MSTSTLLLAGMLALAATEARTAGLTARQVEQISHLATATLQLQGLPALSVAVGRQEQIWAAAFGKADVEQDVAATARSLFRTASVAKWFTAVAALRLAETGALDLDVPVQRYCPQYPRKSGAISPRMLLTHMAGIRHDHGSNHEATGTAAERKALGALMAAERATQVLRHADVFSPLESFKKDPLLFEPGTRVHYSSPGYRVLGCVLEGAARKPYRELMRELIFVPAGMTSIVEDDAQAILPGRVAGYSRESGNLVRAPFRDVSENLPAGGYLATAEDLVRFALAFRAGQLVRLRTRDGMLEHPNLADGTPAPNPMGTPGNYYAMGVMVDPASARPAWFHAGGQAGATALLIYFPSDDVAVGLMTNIDKGAMLESLARQIGAIAAQQDP